MPGQVAAADFQPILHPAQQQPSGPQGNLQSVLQSIANGLRAPSGNDLTKMGADVAQIPAASQTNPNAETNSILNAIKGYTYGQEEGSGASSLAKQLSSQLSNLPSADAAKIMKQLTGTTLGSDIAGDISGASVATPPNPYGFDPLSLGTIFSKTMAPWLQQQQGFANSENASLAKQMQSALSGASPAMQQALGGSIPQMQAANAMMNTAATDQIKSAPQWDQFVAALTNATNTYKLAQAVGQAEPYVAQTVSGATPNAPAGSQSAAASQLNTIFNAIATTGALP